MCTFASQPSAGFLKILIQIFHHQVDGAAMSPADEAAEGVLAHLERERGVYQLFTFLKLRNVLDGKVAELLQFILFHKKTLPPAPPCEGGE